MAFHDEISAYNTTFVKMNICNSEFLHLKMWKQLHWIAYLMFNPNCAYYYLDYWLCIFIHSLISVHYVTKSNVSKAYLFEPINL